jgi:tRNA pseudouridine38-40 synthase
LSTTIHPAPPQQDPRHDPHRDPSPRCAQNWKLTLSYDGTGFSGWQVQPGQPTVQGELQAALGRVTGESPLPQGSGRTDAGVHALGQVASFVLQAAIPAENLCRALNRALPAAVRILEAKTVPATFHARHSTAAKTYEYRVFLEKPTRGDRSTPSHVWCPPFLARYVYAYQWPLDVGALAEAARSFVGTHNFLSFAATDPDVASRRSETDADDPNDNHSGEHGISPPTAIRTIFASAWAEQEIDGGALLIYRVRGSGFLHHMVRNLVGTMLDVGRGYRSADEIPRMIAARSRAAAGPTAPARGLFLHSVEYKEGSES